MAQVYIFTEKLGKAVKSQKYHSVNKFAPFEDKKKVEKVKLEEENGEEGKQMKR